MVAGPLNLMACLAEDYKRRLSQEIIEPAILDVKVDS